MNRLKKSSKLNVIYLDKAKVTLGIRISKTNEEIEQYHLIALKILKRSTNLLLRLENTI